MDLIYIRTRDGAQESGYLSHYEIDFDITNDTEQVTNDFALKMILPKSEEDLLYIENEVETIIFDEGTEFGGSISGTDINIADNTITYTGRTWRGTLDQYIIEPPAGQDYRIVSGNLATILRNLPHSPYIEYEDTSYSIGSFQFDRYVRLFKGAMKLITASDDMLRLSIEFNQTEGEYTGVAKASFTLARDLSSLVEVSQDYSDKVKLSIKRDGNTPKRLICLGKGELHEREVINLYADDDWNISRTSIPGAHPVDTYDFSSSDDLLNDGIKHYKELIGNHKQIDVSISDLDVRLGDIISARDHLTGENVQAEITTIIRKCVDYGEYQNETYEYKTKVRT